MIFVLVAKSRCQMVERMLCHAAFDKMICLQLGNKIVKPGEVDFLDQIRERCPLYQQSRCNHDKCDEQYKITMRKGHTIAQINRYGQCRCQRYHTTHTGPSQYDGCLESRIRIRYRGKVANDHRGNYRTIR